MALRGEQYRRFVQRIDLPAVGAEIDIVPFGQGTWRIQSMIFTLVTSAAAGIRVVQLSATDGTTEWWRSPAVVEIPPSSTAIFVSHPGIVGGGAVGAEVSKQASTAFAATASGVAALANGDSITGFTINTQAVGAAVAVDVTVTNIAGGTQTFRITSPTTGQTLTFNFPDPIPALNAGVAPTVTYPGAAGTPAGSVIIFGRSSTLDNVASLAMPDEGLVLPQGFHVRTLTAARDAGDQFSAVAICVEELPSGPDYAGQSALPFVNEPLDN